MSAIATSLAELQGENATLFPSPLLPHVVQVENQGPGLLPATELGRADVLALHLTRGCFHRCAICAVRSAPTYSGDNVLALYTNAAEQLAADLAGREHLPSAVFISPSMDPFPPHEEVQAITARVVAALARRGVEAWLMTRGLIRPWVLNVLEGHRGLVKVTVPITTLQRDLQRTIEPLTAPPRLRLRQIAELRRRGIGIRVVIEPLLPELTDTTDNLDPLLRALAAVGVREVTTSYLFLREGIIQNLTRALGESTAEMIEDAFKAGPVLNPHGQGSSRFLPRTRRQRGYAHLMALAATHGINVRISRSGNPDFGPPPAPDRRGLRQLLPLFLEAGKDQSNPENN